MYRRFSSPDQLAPAELGQLLPILLEDIERISVFEILECNEPIAEAGSKISCELPRSHDETVVVKLIENKEPFAGHLQLCGIDPLSGSEAFQNAVRRTWR